MRLKPIFRYETPAGAFFISQSDDGRFHPVFDNESLGSYHTAIAAVSDLAGGHTVSVAGIKDIGALGIPDDLAEWIRM